MSRIELAPLPLDLAWSEIEGALQAHKNLVLVAEPGAGKTTRFPPRLLQTGLLKGNQKVLVLEPRRLAARASAARIATEQNWDLGDQVGYQVRFENKTGLRTRLQFLTEGLLAKRLQTDPELRDVGAVVLDEFHERSQHTDLALGLLFELQQLARPDLRIIVMSATLDAAQVSKFLQDAPIVHVKGRTFPVHIQRSNKPFLSDTGPAFLDRVSSLCLDVMEGAVEHAGDVLVFLPGAREIRGVRERIQTRANSAGFDCFELHGSLPLEEQDRAIRRLPNRSKIVLATNIAETSLTIDGVGTVIDSGLARVARTDAFGFTRLSLSKISLASATQRAGRAGRQAEGYCYRLWSPHDEASMPDFEVAEILRSDLTDPLLALLSQGVSDAEGFSWFEKPPSDAIRFAQRTLTDLGFRDANTGALTSAGSKALRLPLNARLARLLLESADTGHTEIGIALAALLSERDILLRAQDLKASAGIESDVVARLHCLNGEAHTRLPLDRVAVSQVKRVRDQLERAIGSSNAVKNLSGDEDEIAMRLLMRAFPDRLCRRRKAKEPAARMVGVKGVRLAPFSTVETSELFVAIDASEPPPHLARGDAQITIASAVNKNWIAADFPDAIETLSRFEFDSESLNVQKLSGASFRDLPIEAPHVSRPTADEAFPILMAASRDLWDTKFLAHESLAPVLERLAFLKAGEDTLSFDAASVRDRFLEEVCYGETSLRTVLAKDLGEAYGRHLPSEIGRSLAEQAPERIVVPSGSQIRIHYPAGRNPYLEVRIQEMFGLLQTPRLGRERIPLTIHLLGPNYRPVQVTSDLESFWKNGYPEVRKELRLKYPKHSWPEDPYSAKPEAKGRRRS